jgi:hypothetical protein
MEAQDAQIIKYLGPRFAGRRYLRYGELEALGIVHNRASLRSWVEQAGFPRPIRIPGPYGCTLVWLAGEVTQYLAERAGEREISFESEAGAPVQEAPVSNSDDPFAAGSA